MELNPHTNHLKKKYLNFTSGPILFTAPHSKRVNRGGKEYDEKLRVHQRQIYTSYLAVYLAKQTKLENKQYNSFCVWGKSSYIDEQDLDPNYLMEKNLHKSPFHCALHSWVGYHLDKSKDKMPKLLHIDIHGKLNRKKDCQIDIGFQSMKVHWEKDILTKMITNYFQKQCESLFEKRQFGQFKCRFETQPYLHGYWGGHLRTMTDQAIRMNIPSLQMEIPLAVRKELFRDQQFRKDFAKVINKFYNRVIVPWYQKNDSIKPFKFIKQIGLKVESNIKNYEQAEQVLSELDRMEKKQQIQFNKKHI